MGLAQALLSQRHWVAASITTSSTCSLGASKETSSAPVFSIPPSTMHDSPPELSFISKNLPANENGDVPQSAVFPRIALINSHTDQCDIGWPGHDHNSFH